MRKKIYSIFLMTVLIFCMCVPVHSAVIDEVIEEQELIRGVTYRHILRLEESGWQDIHVVQTDLKAPDVKIEVLKDKQGASYMDKTSNLAKAADALAAINADFFSAKRGESGRGSSVGVEVLNGELQSSASVAENMNTLYKNFREERFYIDAFQFDITVTATNGKTDTIKLINKYDDLTGIVMYTDDWSETSVGSEGGIIEVSVDKKGKVLEKVTESAPIAIPDGGYVLSAHLSYNTFLLDHVNVGDIISVDIKSTPDTDRIEAAVGGGGVLVRDGQVPQEFSHNITGRQPRSAVGLDKTGTVISFVTVDGRRKDAVGMTQEELGQFMAELGCYTALNFDGGGSAAMVVDKGNGQEVVNKPSDGNERNVTNALGVVAEPSKNSPVTALKIKSADSVFMGAKLPISIVGIDKYHREKELKLSSVKVRATGGVMEGNLFRPNGTGKAVITVSMNGFSAKKEITVLDTPREIYFEQEKVSIEKDAVYTPVLMGKDADGNRAPIRLSDTRLTVSDNAVALSAETLVGKTQGAAVVTAYFGAVTANMAVMVDGAPAIGVPQNVTIPDTQNKESTLYSSGAYRFAVFGNTREAKTLFDRYLMNLAMHQMKQNAAFQVFLGADVYTSEIERVCTDYMSAKRYECTHNSNSTFIMLPNVSGNIYNGDTSVWTSLREDVKRAGKNLFIFIDRNFISYNQAELITFYNIVDQAADAGKNVYVFGGGFVNQNTVTSQVRYVNTAGIFPSIALDGTHPSYIKYVLVTVNGDDVTFEYKPILGE